MPFTLISETELDCISLINTQNALGSCYTGIVQTRLENGCTFLNQFLQVIMATNRIDILDPALLRPGRIDRKIEFPPPNEEARLDILKIHSRKMNLTRGINLRKIAELMPGASGAEVKVTKDESYVHIIIPIVSLISDSLIRYSQIYLFIFPPREYVPKQECMLFVNAGCT